MSEYMLEVDDATLEIIGAEALWQQHVPEIARALMEQEEGARAEGPIKLTMQIRVGKVGDGVALRGHEQGRLARLCGAGRQWPSHR